MTTDWQGAAQRLENGEIGIIPTDTLYGIVGSALKPAVVERIYKLRDRDLDKPMIVLVADWADIERLGVRVEGRVRQMLEKVWPGAVSVVLPAAISGLRYLHRGTNGIAFRMPAKPSLRAMLQETGPIVAPSANLAGKEPAVSVGEAREYFGDEVFYVDEGTLHNAASALVDARVEPMRVLRSAPGFKQEMI